MLDKTKSLCLFPNQLTINIMKQKLISFLLFTSLSISVIAQIDTSRTIDSLLSLHCDFYHKDGFFKFKDNTMKPGEPLLIYRNFLPGDVLNEFTLLRSETDPFMEMRHDTYQQYFAGIPIEDAIYKEHSSGGFLVTINGRITHIDDDRADLSGILTKQEALSHLSYMYDGWQGDEEFAWENDAWESELDSIIGNDTTYFPYESGKLVWITLTDENLDFHIPNSAIKLVWKFNLLCIEPFFHRDYYVDAYNGKVIMFEELTCTTAGTAVNLAGDPIDIDIKHRGWPNNDYILKTENNGIDIHTKETNLENVPWSLVNNATNGGVNWGSSFQRATTSHWAASEAWFFFKDNYYHEGTKGNGNGLKVRAVNDEFNSGLAYFANHSVLGDEIKIGENQNGYFGGNLWVIGHEYTHGVTKHSANLKYKKESGALNESFSDIFGLMSERYSRGGTFDWIVGDETQAGYANGDMSDPSLYDKPETYENDINWIDVDCGFATPNNDYCGVHPNKWVQNFWFHLLADGGSGTNGNGDAYQVYGLGMDDAAKIAFLSLRFYLIASSDYESARLNSIEAARAFFGECSLRHQSTAGAWSAVGVDGDALGCIPFSVNETTRNSSFRIYPNPCKGPVTLGFDERITDGHLEIYGADGVRVFNMIVNIEKLNLDLSFLTSGLYHVVYKTETAMFCEKLIRL